MASRQLQTLYRDLQRAFDARPTDLKKCGVLLAQLKINLIETGLLLPNGEASLNDMVIARDILEIGAFWSIRAKDVPSFDRYFSQLHTFYTDYRSSLPPSKPDFHTTLESLPLPADEINLNPYIRHPVNLERWLMEGSYSKVWNAREEAPAEEVQVFRGQLDGNHTVYLPTLPGSSCLDLDSNEIASCEEVAYESLPIKDVATLLFFSSQSELLKYAQERGWQVDLSAGLIRFARKSDEQMEIPKQKLIEANLAYARELEQIV
ncbi:hypothetical protein F5141DRAFT_144203 [Pisolithus sp. B1]|nr:hypothetical protein F5141DRAFT_144203 [Pisolithus sp. B1]